MFKKLAERFPAATAKGSAVFESLTHSVSPGAEQATIEKKESSSENGEETLASPPATETNSDATSADGSSDRLSSARLSIEGHTASMKAALSEKINSETVSAAASIAASSMFSFMKRAQSVAAVAAREGAAKATVLKSKAMDYADMDALQRRLSHVLDRSTGEVNLELLNFSYINDNIVAMGFPSMNSGTNRTLIRDNPIDLVAMYLNVKHGGHYMIWNLSEETYDYSYFENQVLEFNFPGHPAPPLGLMFKICSSIESWLEADDKNLAVIHCLTGKGRTGTVIACYLAWIGQFPTALEALQYVAEKRNSTIEKLTIPSQRRYIQYFNHVMDGVKPRSSPLLLRRVIMNTIPVFGRRTTLEPVKPQALTNGSEGGEDSRETEVPPVDANAEPELEEVVEEGCCPYLQIFKGGKLVFTTTWRDMENGNGVQWASTNEGSISFNVNCMLQGDVLIRCRHLTDSGERMSMFRGAFHTGYIPQGILRLTKVNLDGACGDDRFDQDFFIDLIFADVQTEGERGAAAESEGVALNEEDRQAYEDMLHRDEAFWEDIEARKQRLQKQREEQLRKRKERESARLAEEKAAAEAAEAAVANAAAEEEERKKAQEAASRQAAALAKSASFSIGAEDEAKAPKKVNRRGSWDEEKDKQLMNELESLTSGALSKVANDDALPNADLEEKPLKPVDTSAVVTTEETELSPAAHAIMNEDPTAVFAKEFDEIKQMEKELGLEALSSSLADSPGGEFDNLSPTNLDLLDAELEGLSAGAKSAKKPAKDVDDVLNFGADDFDELEEYLSGLSSK